jgi:hypothetical protein
LTPFRKAISLADEVQEEKNTLPEKLEKWKDEHTVLNKEFQ